MLLLRRHECSHGKQINGFPFPTPAWSRDYSSADMLLLFPVRFVPNLSCRNLLTTTWHMDHAENARTTGNSKSHGMDLQHPFSFLSRYQISLIATANRHYPFAVISSPRKQKKGDAFIYILCMNKFQKKGFSGCSSSYPLKFRMLSLLTVAIEYAYDVKANQKHRRTREKRQL